MALQASGQISASDISREFGQTTNISFNAYRISQTPPNSDLTLPLDTGIPTSGEIKFSDFYSKRLNIVVNCAPTNTIQTRITARTRYNNDNDITVIGGFRGKPSSTSGSKVWIHTNEIRNIPIGSYISEKMAHSDEPSLFWYRKSDHILQLCYTKIEDISLDENGEAVRFIYSTQHEKKKYNYYASRPGFHNDFPHGFLYAIDCVPYDHDQEPEDDCL